mmetsp:Transcript_19383/g.29306  ORF Transcript_19383/g.29306 Transcript_19383/m.29306 type:complete len:225 (-) Transcript_19383:93-767(-)
MERTVFILLLSFLSLFLRFNWQHIDVVLQVKVRHSQLAAESWGGRWWRQPLALDPHVAAVGGEAGEEVAGRNDPERRQVGRAGAAARAEGAPEVRRGRARERQRRVQVPHPPCTMIRPVGCLWGATHKCCQHHMIIPYYRGFFILGRLLVPDCNCFLGVTDKNCVSWNIWMVFNKSFTEIPDVFLTVLFCVCARITGEFRDCFIFGLNIDQFRDIIILVVLSHE